MIIEINSHLFCATMMNFCLIVNENEPPVCVYDDIYKIFCIFGIFFLQKKKRKNREYTFVEIFFV